jgi:hypothetical protein
VELKDSRRTPDKSRRTLASVLGEPPFIMEERRLRLDSDRPWDVVAKLGAADVEITTLHVDQPDLEAVLLGIGAVAFATGVRVLSRQEV